MSPSVTLLLRGVIAAFALASLTLGAIVLPLIARDVVLADPAYEAIRLPYLVAAEAALACALIGLLALWILLGRVRRDRIFSPASLRWVDAIIGAAAAATVLTGLVFGHQMIVPAPGIGPAAWLLALLALAGLGFMLTMLVMRHLLVTAVGLRSDLDEVI